MKLALLIATLLTSLSSFSAPWSELQTIAEANFLNRSQIRVFTSLMGNESNIRRLSNPITHITLRNSWNPMVAGLDRADSTIPSLVGHDNDYVVINLITARETISCYAYYFHINGVNQFVKLSRCN